MFVNPPIHQFGLDIFSAAFKKVDSLRIFGTFDPLALPGVAAGADTDEAAIAPEQTHGKSDLAQVAGARGSNFHWWFQGTRVGSCYTTSFLWTQQLGCFAPEVLLKVVL